MTRPRPRARGQLVLVAAGVIAVALVPMVLAYIQLGYHGDVSASGEIRRPGEPILRLLDRVVHEASSGVTGEYRWRNRDLALDAFNRTLDPMLLRVERSRVKSGVGYRIRRNATAAATWAAARCPSGPKREFGPCLARSGVVVQERAGEVHVLAVGLDVTVVTERGSAKLTVIVRSIGGRRTGESTAFEATDGSLTAITGDT